MNMTNTIKSLDTKTMLALYNALTGKSTSKFASREKGEAQTMGAAKVAGQEAVAAELAKLGVEVVVNPLTPKAKPLVDHGPSNAHIAAAIAKNPELGKTQKAKLPKTATRKARGTNLVAPPGAPVACREGSKQAMLLDMLRNPEGVTMAELIAALSGGNKPWTEATVRSGFGWDMKQKGYGVRSEFDADGTERFFIVLPTDEQGNEFAIPPHRPLKGAPKADARQIRLEV